MFEGLIYESAVRSPTARASDRLHRVACASAWGPDADRRSKYLISLILVGFQHGADSHHITAECIPDTASNPVRSKNRNGREDGR